MKVKVNMNNTGSRMNKWQNSLNHGPFSLRYLWCTKIWGLEFVKPDMLWKSYWIINADKETLTVCTLLQLIKISLFVDPVLT